MSVTTALFNIFIFSLQIIDVLFKFIIVIITNPLQILVTLYNIMSIIYTVQHIYIL
jgi:malate/lactate dehydrogenase